MIHICKYCEKTRDCGCRDCGEPELEICTRCNNIVTLELAGYLGIPKSDLSMDPLGGYHFKKHQLERK